MHSFFLQIFKSTIKHCLIFLLHIAPLFIAAQSFVRHELSAGLDIPWEIQVSSDGYIWVSESKGRICRINPITGLGKVVYTAPDYFNGSALENSPNCFKPKIGAGTLGMALHPAFPDSPTIFLVYSYNSGNSGNPATRFKIISLLWNGDSLIQAKNIVLGLPNGYDHLGGRLICTKENSGNYLYLSTGDNGISENGNPDCYIPQSANPNNFTQDTAYLNGKILRYYVDGSIPPDNPLPNNPFFTRGHRNAQGLVFNAAQGLLYAIEHGDRTDDEINLLIKGMNYGWKNVRGYTTDNNFAGEKAYADTFHALSAIPGDRLVDPLYVWCATEQPTSNNNLDWCTVAPSDGLYYQQNTIPFLHNSLLIVTLKAGNLTRQEVYVFHLTPNGKSLLPSTLNNPNPVKLFSYDDKRNGRLRDIALSPDGKSIYLINNGGAATDRVIVYHYQEGGLTVFPNPTHTQIQIHCTEEIIETTLYATNGSKLLSVNGNIQFLQLANLSNGIYICDVKEISGKNYKAKVVKI